MEEVGSGGVGHGEDLVENIVVQVGRVPVLSGPLFRQDTARGTSLLASEG